MTRVAEPSPVDVVAPSARRRSRPALQVGVCVAGYLYGSLPFVYLLGRTRHVDLRARDDGRRLMTTRGKAVPLGCLLATTLFPVIYRVVDRTRTTTLVPSLLPAVIVLRRMTARAPDDAECGPAAHPVALLYRLLYDRNTST